MKPLSIILLIVLLAAMLPVAPAAAALPYAIDYFGHVVISCDSQPDQIEIRFYNAMPVTLKVSGELWAQPTGGSALLISGIPPEYSTVAPGFWGGPEERIVNRYPDGFTGMIWGWGQLALEDGTVLGRIVIPEMPLDCGHGSPVPPVEYETHSVAACGIEPNQLEIRIHNLMGSSVTVTGELWAQPMGESPQLISAVPEPYRQIVTGGWGGPEERLSNPYPGGFTGSVYGWGDISDGNGQSIGSVEMSDTTMACASAVITQPTLKYIYMPMLSK